ncbi:PREDICTED: probable calcium-binding protein CML32 [Camelina sativa]|uniref:Probable calcium-binding protein CML32 n=1 Tax=Camelina sativa TaxID=90675 RepID=A0ABM0SLB2_CAMSA|nr:PREDICTED: probable calcium-binding protein CML32 [Camelina sativa]
MSVAQIFERVDKNKDGKISWDEFAEAIRVFSPEITSEEIDKMFRVLDTDGDNQIDEVEFASCLMLNGEGEEDDEEVHLREAFDLYDKDRDGKISASEIHMVLKGLGEKKTMEECVAMVRAVDKNGDGFVDFEEFKIMMTSNNKSL